MKNIIIIGSGIISQTLIYYLQRIPRYKEHHFIQIADQDFYPNCSDSSTATVALRNTQKGISELGDFIVNGFEFFKDFNIKYRPAGIEEANHCFATLNKSEKFIRRYGSDRFNENSYLVNWPEYSNWLKSNRLKEVELIKDIALPTDGKILKTKNLGSHSFEYVFWCTNGNPFLKIKKRPGSYLECSFNISDSQIFEIDGINIILRKSDQKLIIGSTTEIANHHIPNIEKLKALHSTTKNYLKTEQSISIPAFDHFTIKTGVRSLGGRLPKIAKLSDHEWGIFDLNKNGYLLSHYLCQQLIKEL